MRKRIFISSVQKEFAAERAFLKRYIENNPILSRFFSVFAFEIDVPAADKTTSEVYLEELSRCDIYLGLIGREYGYEDADGISPTEREFDEATRLDLDRLVFVKGGSNLRRKQKEKTFLQKASSQLTWQAFQSQDELLTNVYSALDGLLASTGAYHLLPFDARPCDGASLNDISEEKIKWFLQQAREERRLPLKGDISLSDLLLHLRLIEPKTMVPLNAAVLLFGKDPQRFFIPSEVKCAYWHGPERIKPVASYKIFHGTLFDMADQALDFVMSKLDRSIGTRDNGPIAEAKYELPEKVVAEMIINGIAHRDYDSTGSVQVEVFSDRVFVLSPGAMNPSIKPDELTKAHGSFPNNPLIAEVLYQARYIEKMGSGTTDMIRICKEEGLDAPQFEMGLRTCQVTLSRPRKRPQLVQDEETREKTREKIIEALKDNPKLTQAQLSEKVCISIKGIEWNLRKLKEDGIIRRVGPDKGGSWEVLQ